MNLVMLGAPGAGKGTQAKMLAERLNITAVSTGAIIRNEIKKHTELGEFLERLISKGNFAPDEYVIDMIEKTIKECPEGFILDGFPRNLNQAMALDKLIKLDHVININITDEEVIERLTGRRECSKCRTSYHLKYNPPEIENVCDICKSALEQRKDDTNEVIKKRLDIYYELTIPLIEKYKDIIVNINSCEEVLDTGKAILEALGL